MRKGDLADTYGQDLSGWWEVGVGTNVALSDASYLYLDVERTYGGEVDTRGNGIRPALQLLM